jgi:hypothetical protein
MNMRTFGTQHLMRTVAVAAFVVMLTFTMTQRAGANQSGPGVNDATQFQAALCQAGGGTATIEVERTGHAGLAFTKVRCTGGILDGMFCYNGQYSGTQCWFNHTGPQQSQDVDPVGGIEQVPTHPIETSDPVFEAEENAPAEEPVVIQPEVVEESVDPGTAEEPATDQGDGSVDDLPEITEEEVEPVVAEEPAVDGPVFEEVSTVEESAGSGEVIEPVYEIVIDAGIEIEQPILVGQ